jgi:hypothetical protein
MPDYSVLTLRNGRSLKWPEKFSNNLKKYLKKKCTLMYKFVTSTSNEFKIAKSIICFLIGTLYGVLIFRLTVAQIDEINVVFKLILGMLIIAIVSIGMAFEVQMRCIMTLSVVNFVSSSGRIILIAYIIAHITFVGGPIEVGHRNLKELSMSIMCYRTFLVRSYTDSFRIKWRPYKDIIVGLITGNKDVLESGKRVSNLIDTLDRDVGQLSIENMLDSDKHAVVKTENVDYEFSDSIDKVNKIYKNSNSSAGNAKLEKNFNKIFAKAKDVQCNGLMDTGIELCNSGYDKIVQGCKKSLGIFGFACNMIHWLNFCNVKKRLNLDDDSSKEKFCKENADKQTADGIDKDISILDKLSGAFNQNPKISMTYLYSKAGSFKNMSVNTKYQNHLSSVALEATAMKEDLDSVYYYFNLFYSIAKIIASYGFCLVFFQSFRYNKNYLNDITFDNCYITQYFRHIDARRYKEGKKTILPIKKLEEVMLIYPTKLTMLQSQREGVKFGLLLCFLLTSFTIFVIIANYFVADFNQLITRHGKLIHKQTGFHRIFFEVKGKGFFAKLLKKVLKDIHINENVDTETDTAECFPKEHYLKNAELFKFVLFFILLYAAVLSEIFIQRFNRAICAFFYRRWEKQRILWLYNRSLKNRKLYMRNLIKRAIMRSKGFELEPDTSLIAIIIEYLGKLKCCAGFLRLLKVLKIGLAKCILCDQSERIGSIKCDICESLYCYECWMDAQKTCLVCTPSIYEQPDWKFEGGLSFQ